MRRSASEIINSLERRIARLERSASTTKSARSRGELPKYILEDAADSIQDQFDTGDLNYRDFEVKEEGVSAKLGFNYFLVSIVDDDETGEEFYAIISEEDDEHQLDEVYEDEGEAYRTWGRWTK